MRTWYFPSWNGDFRLIPISQSTYRETASDKACVLEVVEPTEAEREMILKFLEVAQQKGWTPIAKLSDEPRQEILLNVGVAEAGKVFITFAKMTDRTITAIRSENGKLVVQDTAELLAEPEVIEGEVVDAPPPEEKKTKKETAVSVQRPTPSCPQCTAGSISRASEVLLSFLTPEEHETWAKHRFIVVQGQITGHSYLLAHRHSPIAVKVGRICFDLDDECVVHFHDNSVPPEEEVLAAKLILQHREPWLRNEATVFGPVPDGALQVEQAIRKSLNDDFVATMDGSVYPVGTYSLPGPCVKEYDDETGELMGIYELPPATLYTAAYTDTSMLNPVTLVNHRLPEMIFKNPFGDGMDGVPDAHTTQQVGAFIQGMLGTLAAKSR